MLYQAVCSTFSQSCLRSARSKACSFHTHPEWKHCRLFQCIRYSSTLPNTAFFRAVRNHDPTSNAVTHSKSGNRFSYGRLVSDVARAKEELVSNANGKQSLHGQRLAFLAENSYEYVVMLLSILSIDAIAVPLSPAFPIAELRYILGNSEALMLLATETYSKKAHEILEFGLQNRLYLDIRKDLDSKTDKYAVPELEDVDESYCHGGLMLYTSGTTNRPKGVVIPQSALIAQARSLIQAWKYSPQDHLLHLLPLHHIHGTVNALLTPLVAGSTIEFMYPFNAEAVWSRLAAPFLTNTSQKEKITFLTAVPTVYTQLMSNFPGLPAPIQKAAKEGIRPENLRLNISGSAALPTPTKRAWAEISGGNILLERYGMTEVGMALSCGLDPADRVDSSVGWPLPSVETRLWDFEKGEVIEPGSERDESSREREGEIQLRGPTIFREYFGNEKATAESFVDGSDGQGKWFRTGDVAIRRMVPSAGTGTSGDWAKGPMYFIQGRLSTDIVKVGGEKVSALEVERELLSLPQITEAAVVGLPSEQWGQKVAAVVVLSRDASVQTKGGSRRWGVMDVRRALKSRLANYKLPQVVKVLEGAIPRNAMGKVNKKTLVKEVFGDRAS